MISKESFSTLTAVWTRAKNLGIVYGDKTSFIMDIESADVDLLKLLTAPEFDFRHDIVGIQNNMDRSSYPGKLLNCFLPRCSL